MFKKIKVLIPSLLYLVTPDSSFYYHVVYIHVHTERKLRKENNLHRKINTRSCIRHVTDLITCGTRYSDNCVNGFVNGWQRVDKILLELLRQVTQEGRGWGLGWGWGWLWGAATRSSPLEVYFADFLRPESFFFLSFLPIYSGTGLSLFWGLSIQETLSFRGNKNLVAEKCSHYWSDTSTHGKGILFLGPETWV